MAETHGCDLIVIATHGRSGFDHVVYGSVCEKVARQAPVPVLCIKHPEHEFVDEDTPEIHLRRVLFPYDFSSFSRKALPYAHSLCRQFGAKLILMHVAELPAYLPEMMPDAVGAFSPGISDSDQEALDEFAGEFPDVDVETVTRTGLAHREICKFVAESDVDLVVMPTHGCTGIAHILFGGVAEKVVRLAKCPVLTVRPDKVPAHVVA